jgi:hypothetical protein
VAGETLRVDGYRQLMVAFQHADKDSRRELRRTLARAGEHIQRDATARFSRVNARSAAGYRVRVRQRGIAVEQSIRKTTGLHPEYGALQMRTALLPALMENQNETVRALERALDEVADRFDAGG